MAIFKSNPEKSVQRDIDAATKNRERLSAQIVEFEQAITRYAAAAKQAALTGDDADLDRAEVSLRAAQDRRKTLKAALADVEQELAALERTKTEIADGKLRAQTAAEIELVVRKMIEASGEFDAAAARLSEYTTRCLQIILRMRRDMTGEELDQALATVLGQFELVAERRRRTDWRERESAASRFRAECNQAS